MLLLLLFFLSFCASAMLGMNKTPNCVKRLAKHSKKISTLVTPQDSKNEPTKIEFYNTKKRSIFGSLSKEIGSFKLDKLPLGENFLGKILPFGELKELESQSVENNDEVENPNLNIDKLLDINNEVEAIIELISSTEGEDKGQNLQQEIELFKEKIVELEKKKNDLELNSARLQNKLDSLKDNRYRTDLELVNQEYRIGQLNLQNGELSKELLVSTEQNRKLVNQQKKLIQQENNSQHVIEELALHNLELQNEIQKIENEKEKLVKELSGLEKKFEHTQQDFVCHISESHEQKNTYERLLKTAEAKIKKIELEYTNDKVRFNEEQEKLKKILEQHYQEAITKNHKEHEYDKERLNAELGKVKFDYEITLKNQMSELTEQFAKKERKLKQNLEEVSLEQKALSEKIKIFDRQKEDDSKKILNLQGQKTEAQEQLILVKKELEHLQECIGQYKQDVTSLQNHIDTKNQAIKNLEQKLEEVEQQLEKASKDNGLLSDNLGSVFIQSQQSNALLSQDKNNLLQRLSFQQEENKDLKKQLTLARKNFEIKKNEALKLTRQLKEERGEVKNANHAVDKLMADMIEVIDKLSSLQKEHNLLSKKFSDAESTLEQKDKIAGNFKQELDESQNKLQDALHSINELQKQVRDCKKFKEETVPTLIQQKTNELKKEYELKLFERDERIDRLTENNDKNIVDIENIKKEKEVLQKQLDAVPEKIQHAVQQAESRVGGEYQKKVANLRTQHELVLKGLQEDKEKSLHVLQEDHNKKLTEVREIYDNAKEKILAISGQKIKKLSDDAHKHQKNHEAMLRNLEEQHKNKLHQLEESSKTNEQELVNSHRQKLRELKADYTKEKELSIHAITAEFEERLVALKNEIQEKDKQQQKLAQKVYEQEQEIKKVQELHDQNGNTIKSLKETCMQKTVSISNLERAMQSLEANNHDLEVKAKKLEEVWLHDKKEFERELNSRNTQYNNELVKLENQGLLDKQEAQNKREQLIQKHTGEVKNLGEAWEKKEQEYNSLVKTLQAQQKLNEQKLGQLENDYGIEIMAARETIEKQSMQLTEVHNKIQKQIEKNFSLQKEVEFLEKQRLDAQKSSELEKKELELKIANAKNSLAEAEKTCAQQLHDFEQKKRDKEQLILGLEKSIEQYTEKIQNLERGIHERQLKIENCQQDLQKEKLQSEASTKNYTESLQEKSQVIEEKLQEIKLLEVNYHKTLIGIENQKNVIAQQGQDILEKEQEKAELEIKIKQYTVSIKNLENELSEEKDTSGTLKVELQNKRLELNDYKDLLANLQKEKKEADLEIAKLQNSSKKLALDIVELTSKSQQEKKNFEHKIQVAEETIDALTKDGQCKKELLEKHVQEINNLKIMMQKAEQNHIQEILNLKCEQDQQINNLVAERNQNLYELQDVHQKEVNKILEHAEIELKEQRLELEGTIIKLRKQVEEFIKKDELAHEEIVSLKKLLESKKTLLENKKKLFEQSGVSRLKLMLANKGLHMKLQNEEDSFCSLQKLHKQEMQKAAQKFDEIQGILAKLEKELVCEQEQGVEKSKTIDGLKQSQKTLLQELHEVTNKYDQAQQKISDFEQKIIFMAQELNNMTQEFNKRDAQAHTTISNLIEKSEKLKKNIREQKKQKREDDKINKNLTNEVNELNEIVVHRSLENLDYWFKDQNFQQYKKNQVKNLETASQEITNMQQGMQSQRETIDTQQGKINQLQKEKQLLKENNQKQQEDNEILYQNIEYQQNIVTSQNQNIKQLMQQVSSISQQMQKLNEKLSKTELQQRIERGDFYVEKNRDLITIENLKKELEKAQENYQKITSELQNVHDDKKNICGELDGLKGIIEDLKLQHENLIKNFTEQDQEYQKIKAEKNIVEEEAKKLKDDSAKTNEILNKFASRFTDSMNEFTTKVGEKLTNMYIRLNNDRAKISAIKEKTETTEKTNKKRLLEQKVLLKERDATIEKYNELISDLTQKIEEFKQSWRESNQENKNLLDAKKREQREQRENGPIIFKIPVPITNKKKKQKIDIDIIKKDKKITQLTQKLDCLKKELKIIKKQKKVLTDEQKAKIEELKNIVASLEGEVRDQKNSNGVLNLALESVFGADRQKNSNNLLKTHNNLLRIKTNEQETTINMLVKTIGAKDKTINDLTAKIGIQNTIMKGLLQLKKINLQEGVKQNLLNNFDKLGKQYSFINYDDKENINAFLTLKNLKPLRSIVNDDKNAFHRSKPEKPLAFGKSLGKRTSDAFDKYFFLPMVSQLVSHQK
jgi:golgin subfamily B member 1